MINPTNISFNREQFKETEELLNNEINKTISILQRSPMFQGRVTIAIEISDKGTQVRPILYPTKYTPREIQEQSPQNPNQITFNK